MQAYRLSAPFKSSMGRAMGLPFGFAIDETILVLDRVDNRGTGYFVPATGKFRAYHGLLGSVLADGDIVGLRVHPDGSMDWFVDHSINNGMPTVWGRKYKKKDPKLERVSTEAIRRTSPLSKDLSILGSAEVRPCGSAMRSWGLASQLGTNSSPRRCCRLRHRCGQGSGIHH